MNSPSKHWYSGGIGTVAYPGWYDNFHKIRQPCCCSTKRIKHINQKKLSYSKGGTVEVTWRCAKATWIIAFVGFCFMMFTIVATPSASKICWTLLQFSTGRWALWPPSVMMHTHLCEDFNRSCKRINISSCKAISCEVQPVNTRKRMGTIDWHVKVCFKHFS